MKGNGIVRQCNGMGGTSGRNSLNLGFAVPGFRHSPQRNGAIWGMGRNPENPTLSVKEFKEMEGMEGEGKARKYPVNGMGRYWRKKILD